MAANKDGLVVMREAGSPDRLLDINTGRVTDMDGKFVQQLQPTGDDGITLSDYAATLYYQETARKLRRPVTMVDHYGEPILMDLSPNDVHIDRALPNYAAGYSLAESVADIAAPPLLVDQQSNAYWTWDKENAFQRVVPVGSAAGGAVPEVNPTLSSDTYNARPYALASFIPTEVEANADSPLRPKQAAVRRVMNAMVVEREIRVATKLQTSGNWDSTLVKTLGAGENWDGGATSDPLKNLYERIQKSYLPVTGIIMSEACKHALVQNPAVQKYIYAKSGVAPIPSMGGGMGGLSSLLDLPPIYVAPMKYMSTSSVLSYVWGKHVVLIHATGDLASQEDVSTMRTFRWRGMNAPDGNPVGTSGFEVRTYYDPNRGQRGGTKVVVVHNDDEKFTSKFVGGLILNALA